MRITHYNWLGVRESAQLGEIKTAFKQLSSIWHPDKAKVWAGEQTANWEEIFKCMSTAHDTLCDLTKRSEYDRKLSLDRQLDLNSLCAVEERLYRQKQVLENIYQNYVKNKNDPQARIHELEQQLEQSQGDNNFLRVEAERRRNIQTSSESRVRELEMLIKNLRNTNNQQQQEIKALQIQIVNQKKLERQLKSLEQQLKSFQNDNISLHTQITRLQQESKIFINKQIEEISKLKIENKKLQEEKEALGRKVEALTKQNLPSQSTATFFKPPEVKDLKDDGRASHDSSHKKTNTVKLRAQGLQKIYKVLGQTIQGKRVFRGVKLVFSNTEDAKIFQKKFNAEIGHIPGGGTFFLGFGGYLQGLTDRDSHILKLNIVMNSEPYWELAKKQKEASNISCEQLEKVAEGEILIRELEKYIDISNLPQEYCDIQGNRLLNKDEIQAFEVSQAKTKLTESYHVSDDSMFVGHSTKIKSSALQKVYRMIGDYIGVKDKKIFYGIKLVFTNKEQAEQFNKQYCQYADLDQNKNKVNFRLTRGGYSELLNDRRWVHHDEHVLSVEFMNCKAYFESLDYPEKSGELLLKELEKHINISDLPQEYRDAWHNSLLDEEEIQVFEALKENKESPGSKIRFSS
jgi:curved DNA-binding protein CbpA